MRARWVLGFDIGGGSGRCLALDVDSGEVRCASRAWTRDVFRGAGNDFELERVFAELAGAAREVLARGDGAEVVAISATALRFGTVVLDAAGRALLAVGNRDSRAAAEAMALAATAGEELQRRTGHWPLAIQTAARLAHLAKREPATRAKVALSLDGWLAWRLTGVAACDFSQAAVGGHLDLPRGEASPDLLARLGIDASLLPPLAASGTALGGLRADAAEALGLAAGVPVALGGADTQCGLLGVGAVAPGDVAAICGTTAPVQQVRAEPDGDAAGALWVAPHVVRGRFVLESNAGPVGEALAWLGSALFPSSRSPAARLLAVASAAAPGANGVLSSFGTQVMHARRLELTVGELLLSHLFGASADARANLARGVVEGLAHGVRANLEQVRATAGRGTGAVRVAGGLAHSGFWCRTLADVLGEPVDVGAVPEATALGAALCAVAGAGLAASPAEAAARYVRLARLEPDATRAEQYEAQHRTWLGLREAKAPANGAQQGHAIRSVLGAAAAAARAGAAPVRPRILVTAELREEALAALRGIGEVEYASYRQKGRLLTGAALVEALRGFEVLVTEIDLVDARSLLALPELKLVASCRGDAVNLDVEACTALGVPALHTPGRNADAVADLTLAFLLALARKLPAANAFLRDPAVRAGDLGAMGRAYATLRGQELWRKTLGLVGFGAVGRKVAERALAFGAHVIVHDPWLPPERVAQLDAEAVPLDELLARSDFVSLHAAVTDGTRGLLGARELARMKRGAFLVNTARAALVDEDALAAALASGHLAGAALDVFSVEPPGSDHPLLAFPNVIAAPHVGGNTSEVGAHQGEIVAADLARAVRGEEPRHLLNPAVWPAFDWRAPRAPVDAATEEWLRARPEPSVTDLQRDRKKTPAASPAPARARGDARA